MKKSLGLDLTYEQTVKNVQEFIIYKVKPADYSVKKSGNTHGSNLLLLHGTKGKNVEGILKEGFKPSIKGSLGLGVYLTNHLSLARDYGNCLVIDKEFVKGMSYVFVVKVKQINS